MSILKSLPFDFFFLIGENRLSLPLTPLNIWNTNIIHLCKGSLPDLFSVECT